MELSYSPAILPFIILFPLLGGIINGLFGKHFPRQVSYAIANAAVLASFLVSVGVFLSVRHLEHTGVEPALKFTLFQWIGAGTYSFDFAFMADPLSSMMLLVVTGVGFLVHLYSTSYMDEDPGYWRYFSYLNLFVFSMLVLVLGKNLAMLFIGWEGVGACSYLLIGFWFKDMDKAEAGQKAFVVNRIGDIGFVVAIFLLLAYAGGSVDYDSLKLHFSQGVHTLDSPTDITLICLLLFVGAMGKSAQIPLYVWLPDAMAGPTPVSALIHAATMVTAGVYMIARLNFIFALSPLAMTIIMVVGALTALMAASIGLVQNDIKKVLAYSTVSQLGYMFIAVGAGAFASGVFHLFTHAFFKACLFLGAGAVIHAMHHEQDIRNYGGLRKKLPVVHATFLVACIAIAGVFPLSGFFSKDAILVETLAFHPETEALEAYYGSRFQHTAAYQISVEQGGTKPVEAKQIEAKEKEIRETYIHGVEKLAIWRKVAFALGLLAAFMTAFYMFRLYFLTFGGEYRGDHHTWEHAHDSPWPMAVPLILLAGLSVVAGWVGMPFAEGKFNFWEHWLEPVLGRGKELVHGHVEPSIEYGLMALSFVVAVSGIGLAWTFYKNGPSEQAASISQSTGGLYRTLMNKYYVDEFYFATIVTGLRKLSQGLFHAVDRVLIDLVMVRVPGYLLLGLSQVGRLAQNGDVQTYLLGTVAGVAALAWYLI